MELHKGSDPEIIDTEGYHRRIDPHDFSRTRLDKEWYRANLPSARNRKAGFAVDILGVDAGPPTHGDELWTVAPDCSRHGNGSSFHALDRCSSHPRQSPSPADGGPQPTSDAFHRPRSDQEESAYKPLLPRGKEADDCRASEGRRHHAGEAPEQKGPPRGSHVARGNKRPTLTPGDLYVLPARHVGFRQRTAHHGSFSITDPFGPDPLT
jgi:hypothetical protein